MFFVLCFVSLVLGCSASYLKTSHHDTFLLQKTRSATNSTLITTSECGVWSPWSCSCCGGCPTQRCVRTCQTTNDGGCGMRKCEGLASKIEITPCTSPSKTCKFPLPVCCDGQQAYVNTTARARWCKSKTKK